jgi:hypothetical protein
MFPLAAVVLSMTVANAEGRIELGDVNIMAVTDVHSWLSGHKHPDNMPLLDADYGDLYSFHHHVKVGVGLVFSYRSSTTVRATVSNSERTESHDEVLRGLCFMAV